MQRAFVACVCLAPPPTRPYPAGADTAAAVGPAQDTVTPTLPVDAPMVRRQLPMTTPPADPPVFGTADRPHAPRIHSHPPPGARPSRMRRA
ncbi:hypothetical protein C8R46DRAFT_1209811 [Mycena filopes]|nr:hypothetical protein C8R46DRAFT_1209811 [Mycena filopes]